MIFRDNLSKIKRGRDIRIADIEGFSAVDSELGSAHALDIAGGMNAIISPYGPYRYRLECSIGGFLAGTPVAWMMVTPSMADSETDDATIRKVIGFSERLGFGDILVCNLFAFRATDIRALRIAADPLGRYGGDHLRAIMRGAEIGIVAWVPWAKLPRWLRNRWMEVVGIAEANPIPLWCLRTAQDRHRLHPLTLGYDRRIRLWQRPDQLRATCVTQPGAGGSTSCRVVFCDIPNA